MSHRRSKNGIHAKQRVNLPRVPLGNGPTTIQDEFWLQKGHAGSINAFRQLSHSVRKGGRKTITLPGGKLQPLFKNHSAPSKQEFEKVFGPRTLPNISPVPDGGNQSKRIVRGASDNLPDEFPSTVRVYLASNYDDMKLERNAIFKYAVPKVQEFCSQRGLIFQLVDMNWGVEKNSIADMGLETGPSEQEIKDCQDISLGPHFVALLGDKYGSYHFVKEIPEDEFEAIHFIATEEVLDNSELLSKYYFRNHNAVHPSYVLQVSENEKEMESLGILVRQAAKLAYDLGKISRKRFYEYFFSSLAHDVTKGIFDTKDPRSHCLAYHREFRNLRKQVLHPEVDNFIDVITDDEGNFSSIDDERQEMKSRLADEVMQHLGVGNCKQYFLSWFEEDKFGKEDEEYAAYLNKLCQDFVQDMKDLIMQGSDKLGHLAGAKPDAVIYQRALHHAHLCQKYSTIFEGQSSLLWKIQNFLRDPRRNTKPFIIHGERGTGKSATISKLPSLVREWFTPDCVTIIRFLGTSSECSTLYRTVSSITLQICQAYGLKLPNATKDFSTLYKTLVTFRSTIEKVSKEHAFINPLFIFLDGLDQLQNHEESLRSMWAIKDLPVNVYVVLSTTAVVGPTNLLGALVALVSADDSTGETEAPTQAEAQRIISIRGDKIARKLTDDQQKKLLETFSTNSQSLYLTQLTQFAYENWESYTVGEKLQLFDNPSARFMDAIDALEDEIGPNIMMFMVAYITVTPIGLQERELVDLLSNNKDVMEEVHKFNLEPPENILFFPPSLLAQAKYDLRSYIHYHNYCGKKVLAWNHSLFYIAAAEKYNLIYPGISEDKVTEEATSFTLVLQEHLADLYLREDRDRLFSQSATRSAKTSLELLQMPQPVTKENMLKLQRLPTHIKVLIPVEGLQRSKTQLMFNLNWLKTKLAANPVHVILNEIQEVSSLTKGLYTEGILDDEFEDLDILFEFFQLAQPALEHDPNNLTGEILGRLLGFKQCFVSKLVQQVQDEGNSGGCMRLLPVYPCLTPPQEPLRHTLPGPTHVIGFLQDGAVAVMFSQKTGVDIWKIETGELLQRFAVNPEQRAYGVIPGNLTEFVIIGHYSHLDHVQQLSVWSSETGVRLVHSTFEQNFEYLALNKTDDVLVVVTTLTKPGSSRVQRAILAVDVQTKEIVQRLDAADIHEDGISKVFFVETPDGTESVITLGGRKGKDLGIWSLVEPGLKHKIDVGCLIDFHQYSTALNLLVCANFNEGVIQLIDVENGKVSRTVRKPSYRGMVDIYVPKIAEFIVIATPRNGVILYSAQAPEEDTIVAMPSQFDDSPPIPSKITMDEEEHFLIIGYENGLLRVYSMGTGDLLAQLEGHTKRINSLAVRDDTLFSAGADGVARVWKYQAKIATEILAESTIQEVNPFVAMKNNGDKLPVIGGDDQKLPHSREDVSCVLIHPDGTRIISSSYSGPIKIWDISTGELTGKIEEDCEHGVTLIYPAYKNKLLVGHCNLPNTKRALALKVWKMDTLSPVHWEGSNVQIFCSRLFPSDDRILTFSPTTGNRQAGIVIGIYDLFDMKPINLLHCNIFGSMDCTNLNLIGFTEPKPDAAEEVPQTPDGSSDDSNKLYAILDYYPQPNLSFFFTFVIKGDALDQISMESHEPIHIDTVSPDCCVVLPHGQCLLGTVDGTLLVWDVVTQKVLGNLYDRAMLESVREGKLVLENPNTTGRPAHDGSVSVVLLNNAADAIVTGGKDGRIKRWSFETHKMTCSIKPHKSWVICIKVLQDTRVLSGSLDNTVALSDLSTGAILACFYTHAPVLGLDALIDKDRVIVRAGEDHCQLMLLNVTK